MTHELAEESDIARRHQAVAREPATPLYDAFHSFERIQLLSRWADLAFYLDIVSSPDHDDEASEG